MLKTRKTVLQLYKRILGISKTWKNDVEAKYIYEEAHGLFKKNKTVSDPTEIQNKIFEAESRIELGLHYGIPYPRYYNHSTGFFKNKKKEKESRAAYLDSYYDIKDNPKKV